MPFALASCGRGLRRPAPPGARPLADHAAGPRWTRQTVDDDPLRGAVIHTLGKHRSPTALRCQTGDVTRRFLTLADVAELLNVSASQTYALVRSGDLRAIKVGGRGQWRVEQTELERFIAEKYEQTEQFIATHPYTRPESEDSPLEDSELA